MRKYGRVKQSQSMLTRSDEAYKEGIKITRGGASVVIFKWLGKCLLQLALFSAVIVVAGPMVLQFTQRELLANAPFAPKHASAEVKVPYAKCFQQKEPSWTVFYGRGAQRTFLCMQTEAQGYLRLLKGN